MKQRQNQINNTFYPQDSKRNNNAQLKKTDYNITPFSDQVS